MKCQHETVSLGDRRRLGYAPTLNIGAEIYLEVLVRVTFPDPARGHVHI